MIGVRGLSEIEVMYSVENGSEMNAGKVFVDGYWLCCSKFSGLIGLEGWKLLESTPMIPAMVVHFSGACHWHLRTLTLAEAFIADWIEEYACIIEAKTSDLRLVDVF